MEARNHARQSWAAAQAKNLQRHRKHLPLGSVPALVEPTAQVQEGVNIVLPAQEASDMKKIGQATPPLSTGTPVHTLGRVVWAGNKLGEDGRGQWTRS